MRPWDVCDFRFPHGSHPCVILSSEEVLAHRNEAIVLACRSLREPRPPKRYEVILDEEDGLDWKTWCRCDFLYTVSKEQIGQKRGSISFVRRREIAVRVLKCLAFAGL